MWVTKYISPQVCRNVLSDLCTLYIYIYIYIIYQNALDRVGFEPGTPISEVRRLIHCSADQSGMTA